MTIEERAKHMAGMLGKGIEAMQPLSTESRNSVLRLRLFGGEGAVLKLYDAQTDPHWANRFRREEKVLTLLGDAHPAVAPRVLGGFIAPHGPAMLLMEDAGGYSLADALTEAGALRLWNDAADFLCGLHGEMLRRRAALRRTAMSISLDRITAPILTARFRIASQRVLGQTPPAGVFAEAAALVRPLLATGAPRAMIHNSMSPLNIVHGPGGWRAIDWETITEACPVWDWAELLRAPYHPLDFEVAEALAVAILEDPDRCGGRVGYVDTQDGFLPRRHTAADLFRRAVFSRHLDSLATVTQRRRRYEEEGRTDRAAEYARRAAFYARDLHAAMDRLEPHACLQNWIWTMTEEAML